jgi:hypothetical protein
MTDITKIEQARTNNTSQFTDVSTGLHNLMVSWRRWRDTILEIKGRSRPRTNGWTYNSHAWRRGQETQTHSAKIVESETPTKHFGTTCSEQRPGVNGRGIRCSSTTLQDTVAS